MAISKEIRLQIYNKYDCRCAYCGTKLEYKELQVDHIKPRLHGGSDDIENLNPSCRSCNFYKSTFTIDQFRSYMATLHERVVKSFIVRLAIKYKIATIIPFDGLFYFEKVNIKL